MADFIQNLKVVIEDKENACVTENGAVGYKTTGRKLLDLNFKISSMRKMSEEDKRKLLSDAYNEDKKLFIKWLFFAGDVRGGCGERDLFRLGFRIIADKDPIIAKALLKLIPEYTRWDNLIVLADIKELTGEIVKIIKKQLNCDMESMQMGASISLLAKWMPSNNTSSVQTRARAHFLAKSLGITDKAYRKMLSALRKYMDVVEVKLSSKQFSEIDYETVPSKANIKYSKAFMRNDTERRKEFLLRLQSGEATINGSVNFPYEVVHMYSSDRFTVNPTVEALWKALPDYVNGQGHTICVADGSGSMCSKVGGNSSVTALEVCNALSIYFSEHSSGKFKNKFITFSKKPKLVDLSMCTSLNEKLNKMYRYNETANTNIERVFDILLETAVSHHMSQEEIPDVLILSDMEFDSCVVTGRNYKVEQKDFAVIRQKFEEAGYRLPRLTFWNICSRTGAIPVKENDLGVALVSGFSPAVVKMVLSNKLDPWEILMEQLNEERYNAVGKILEEAA